MKTAIIHGVLLIDGREYRDQAVVFEHGKIQGILPTEQLSVANMQIIDVQGNYVSAGWIDLHTHGIAGYDFMDAEPEMAYGALLEYARHGVTGVYPTTMSAPFPAIRKALQAVSQVQGGAAVLGVHLEGPYFSAFQCGAQPPDELCTPEDGEYRYLVEEFPLISRIDMAPELPGSAEAVDYLHNRGIVCGIAHTNSDATTILEAPEGVYSIATHLYSGMSGVHRNNGFRRGGAVEACLLRDDIYCETICDGIHLPPELIQLIYKVKGPERMILVSDSMRGAALPEGTNCRLGNRYTGLPVVVSEGVAWLPDRSAFAGSIATFDRLIRTAVHTAGIPLTDAVRMSSETPAKAMGLSQKGVLAPGYDADITVFDDSIQVQLTIVGGTVVYNAKEK